MKLKRFQILTTQVVKSEKNVGKKFQTGYKISISVIDTHVIESKF